MIWKLKIHRSAAVHYTENIFIFKLKDYFLPHLMIHADSTDAVFFALRDCTEKPREIMRIAQVCRE